MRVAEGWTAEVAVPAEQESHCGAKAAASPHSNKFEGSGRKRDAWDTRRREKQVPRFARDDA